MDSRTRILIVDDNRSLVRIIEGILQKEGFETLAAFDGPEGLQKAREEKPDLIILDIVMPGIDGYEVACRLQRDSGTAAIPILMLTVKGQVDVAPGIEAGKKLRTGIEEQIEGFDVGAIEFLNKPVKAKELVKRVRAALWWGSDSELSGG